MDESGESATRFPMPRAGVPQGAGVATSVSDTEGEVGAAAPSATANSEGNQGVMAWSG